MKTLENALFYTSVLLAMLVLIASSVAYLGNSSRMIGRGQYSVELAEKYASSELRQYLDNTVSGLEVLSCIQRFADKYTVKFDSYACRDINCVTADINKIDTYREMYSGAEINKSYVAGNWLYYAELLYEDKGSTISGIQFHLVDTDKAEIVWGDLKGFSCAESFNDLMNKYRQLYMQQGKINEQLMQQCDTDYANFYNKRFAYLYYYYSKAYLAYNADIEQNNSSYHNASILFMDEHYTKFKDLIKLEPSATGILSSGYSKFRRQSVSLTNDDEVFLVGELDESLQGGVTNRLNLQKYDDPYLADLLFVYQSQSTKFKFSDYNAALGQFRNHFTGNGNAELNEALDKVNKAIKALNNSDTTVLPTENVFNLKPDASKINSLKEARKYLTGYSTSEDELTLQNYTEDNARQHFKNFYEDYMKYLEAYRVIQDSNAKTLPESLLYYYYEKQWDDTTKNEWKEFDPSDVYYNTADAYHLGFMYNLEKIIQGTECIQKLTSGVHMQSSESLADFERGYNANVLALMNRLTDITSLVGHATSDNDSTDLLDVLIDEIDTQIERRID